MGARNDREGISRRTFIGRGAVAGAGLAAGCRGEHDGWLALSDAEARTLAALCDAIIPADDYPSAAQAGAVTYIDRQLARTYRRHVAAYRAGLRDAEQRGLEQFGVTLAAARPEQQRAVALALEKRNRRFFELVRTHTMESYYGSPRHGGNRDAVSWRMLGLDEPPVRGRAAVSSQRAAVSGQRNAGPSARD
ncbi:MAG: gluconate 2-dehydrogenase subunit 3 family protein [Acidobacteriaceae bacterium]